MARFQRAGPGRQPRLTKTTLERLLGSRARAGILTVLLRKRGAEEHIAEIARIAKLSAPTVKKAVDHLVEDGILRRRTDRSRHYLSVPETLPAYEALFQLVRLTSGLQDSLRELVAADARVSLALLFGSVARGAELPESDIDLILVGRLGLRDAVGLFEQLGAEVRREINPVVYTEEEFRKRVQDGEHFVTAVLESKPVLLKGDISAYGST